MQESQSALQAALRRATSADLAAPGPASHTRRMRDAQGMVQGHRTPAVSKVLTVPLCEHPSSKEAAMLLHMLRV